MVTLCLFGKYDALAAAAIAAIPAAGAGLSTLETVLAVHGTIPSGLERNCGLLSASGTDHARTLGCAAAVPPAVRLFVFLGLAARLAALRSRVTTIAEEFLVLRTKREGLSTIAANELLIFSHMPLSLMLQVCAAVAAESFELIDLYPAFAMSDEFGLELAKHSINSASVGRWGSERRPSH